MYQVRSQEQSLEFPVRILVAAAFYPFFKEKGTVSDKKKSNR